MNSLSQNPWKQDGLAQKERLSEFWQKTQTAWNLGGLVLLLCFLVWLNPVSVSQVFLIQAPETDFFIPATFSSAPATYLLQGQLEKNFFTKPYLTFKADDCLEAVWLDEQVIYQHACSICLTCAPLRIPLPENLAPGTYMLTMQMQNLGGPGMFDLRQVHGFGWLEALITFNLGLIWLLIFERQRAWWSWWVFILAIILMFNYHQATSPGERQYDVDGHREYIQALQQTQQLPGMKQGWETFQPPVYYWLSVGWLKLGSLVSGLESWRWLQLLAGSFYLATVALAIMAWRELGLDQISKYGLLLFALLPAHLFLSARINNDVLLPFFGLLTVFGLEKYLQTKQLGFLAALGVCLALAVMTKMSALALVAGTGLVLLWVNYRNWGESLALKFFRLLLGLGPALVCLLFWAGRSFSQTGNFFYSNTSYLPASQRLGNGLERYLFLDFPALLTEVRFNTYGGQIRFSWPTAWVASAIYGEFDFKPLGFPFFSFLPAAFAVLCLFALLGYLLKPASLKKTDLEERLLWIAGLFTGCQAIFLLAYNWIFPYTANQDFRLWAPVFFPLAILWAFGYRQFLAKIPKPWRWLGQLPKVFLAIFLISFYWALLIP